jgi:LPS export ABC transporter protein LptC
MRRIAGALALVLLCACNPSVQTSNSPSPSASPTSSALSLKFSGRGTATRPIRIVEQRQHTDRVQYELIASSYQTVTIEGGGNAEFQNVRVTFHGKDGSALTADSPKALVNQATNTIEMLGGVHARNNSGATLACDTLTYDHQTEMIYGTGHVAITTATGFRATGDRFESNIALTRTRMQ